EPQLSDRRQPAKDEKPAKKGAPVTITAVGNRLIITSEDPEMRALAAELVRLMTTTPGDAADFEVIRLKNASAVEAAKVLDEAFNGVRRDQQQQQRGRGGFQPSITPFGGPGGCAPLNPSGNPRPPSTPPCRKPPPS